MPSFRILNCNVDRFIPSRAAAPLGPAMTQLLSSSALTICARSAVLRVSRNEAVDRVLDAIPEGWTARLLEEQLKPPPAAISNMVPGEVRKLGETKDWSDLN